MTNRPHGPMTGSKLVRQREFDRINPHELYDAQPNRVGPEYDREAWDWLKGFLAGMATMFGAVVLAIVAIIAIIIGVIG